MKKGRCLKGFICTCICMMTFAFMSKDILAQEGQETVTFLLSDELMDAGYRMQGCTSSAVQCTYRGKTVVGVTLKLNENHRVAAYPAVNDGTNYEVQDIEFRVNDTVVSQPVKVGNENSYRPKPIDFGAQWEDGTVFTAYYRTAAIRYYDGSTLLNSETLRAGTAANSYEPENKETEYEAYTFEKWIHEDGSDADLSNVQLDTDVYAFYTVTPKYEVSFRDGENVLYTSRVLENSTPLYNEIPVKEADIFEDETMIYRTDYTFSHWTKNGERVDPSSILVQEDTVFEAVFEKTVVTAIKSAKPIEPSLPDGFEEMEKSPSDDLETGNPALPAVPEISETITPQTPATPQEPAIPGYPVPSIVRNTDPTVADTVEEHKIQDMSIFLPTTATPAAPDVAPEKQKADGLFTETIAEEETPLASPQEAVWSFMNLVCLLATIASGAYLIIQKDDPQNLCREIEAIVVFIIAAVIFFLTQDMSAAMAWFDGWTMLMTGILLLQLMICFTKNKKIQ